MAMVIPFPLYQVFDRRSAVSSTCDAFINESLYFVGWGCIDAFVGGKLAGSNVVFDGTYIPI